MSQLHAVSGCENAERAADVVFVHGLGGDAFETWRYGADEITSWPHWLAAEFPTVGVWSFGYAGSPSAWPRRLGWFGSGARDAGYGMALPDRGRQALDLMVQRGIGMRPLFFICHSLGGLVVKQVLRTSEGSVEARWQSIFAETRAVLFLATPHSGANLASLAKAFRTIFGATVTLQELQAHDAHLGDLLDWYRNQAGRAGIQTATYFESRDVKGFRIVQRAFAHPGVGTDPVPLDEDHISIAKPRGKDAQVCGAARDLLRRCVLKPKTREFAVGAVRNFTPYELPHAAKNFFGRQTELRQLSERLRARRNTAVVGDAGLGKTALAAEALEAIAADRRALYPEGIVYLDLYEFHGNAEQAWDVLANKLAGVSFLERTLSRERAGAACTGRDFLLVIEGGEELEGEGRAGIREFLSVLSTQNRWLLLTRLHTQADPAESIVLREALHPEDAAALFDSFTQGRVTGPLREGLLELLEGHPLAVTWGGNLLARDDEDPAWLIADWTAAQLRGLSDPKDAEHTLDWLFTRSVRGLDENARQVLYAAALLARTAFPLSAVEAILPECSERERRQALRRLADRSLLRKSPAIDEWQFTHVLGYQFARSEHDSNPEMRIRLGTWLHKELTVVLRTDGADGDSPLITRALDHLVALLRADPDQRLWTPLTQAALYEFPQRFRDLGRLALVKLSLSAVASWLENLPGDATQEPYWLRERSVLTQSQGNVLREQGDLAGALDAFRQSLAVRQRLAAADPSNADWQRDLSWSLSTIAAICEQQGSSLEALRLAIESLRIDERLAALDPSKVTWQKDVAFSRALVDRLRTTPGQGEAES